MADFILPQCTCEPTQDKGRVKLDPECKRHGQRAPVQEQRQGERGLLSPLIAFNANKVEHNTIATLIERTRQAQFKRWFHEHLTTTVEYGDIYDMIEEITETAWMAGYKQCISDSRKQQGVMDPLTQPE